MNLSLRVFLLSLEGASFFNLTDGICLGVLCLSRSNKNKKILQDIRSDLHAQIRVKGNKNPTEALVVCALSLHQGKTCVSLKSHYRDTNTNVNTNTNIQS